MLVLSTPILLCDFRPFIIDGNVINYIYFITTKRIKYLFKFDAVLILQKGLHILCTFCNIICFQLLHYKKHNYLKFQNNNRLYRIARFTISVETSCTSNISRSLSGSVIKRLVNNLLRFIVSAIVCISCPRN